MSPAQPGSTLAPIASRLALFLPIAACSVPTEDACATAHDGICDELSTCALGSDTTDCDQACEKNPWPASARGACAYDQAINGGPESQRGASTDGSGGGGLAGTWDGTVTVQGNRPSEEVERHFRVYAPRRIHSQTPAPVLFNLGGFTVDQYFLDEYTELNRTADLNGFIVVYGHPEWRDFGSDWVWAWYVYENAFLGPWEDNPDLVYLRAVYEEVAALYNIDESRVYVSGHSRGGALSIISAFEMPDVFAGFCAQAGFADVNEFDLRMETLSSHPAAMLVHGDADPDVNVSASDAIAKNLDALGWTEGEDLEYLRLSGVTHRWQPQYNEQMWEFLSAHKRQQRP